MIIKLVVDNMPLNMSTSTLPDILKPKNAHSAKLPFRISVPYLSLFQLSFVYHFKDLTRKRIPELRGPALVYLGAIDRNRPNIF